MWLLLLTEDLLQTEWRGGLITHFKVLKNLYKWDELNRKCHWNGIVLLRIERTRRFVCFRDISDMMLLSEIQALVLIWDAGKSSLKLAAQQEPVNHKQWVKCYGRLDGSMPECPKEAVCFCWRYEPPNCLCAFSCVMLLVFVHFEFVERDCAREEPKSRSATRKPFLLTLDSRWHLFNGHWSLARRFSLFSLENSVTSVF